MNAKDLYICFPLQNLGKVQELRGSGLSLMVGYGCLKKKKTKGLSETEKQYMLTEDERFSLEKLIQRKSGFGKLLRGKTPEEERN